MKNYYETLEIKFGADIQTVKKGYRMLAFKYHPDRNKSENATLRFIEITEAYEVLNNPNVKSGYDKMYSAFINNDSTEIEKSQTTKKSKEWSHYGRMKAKEYSRMRFDIFVKNAIDEIKLGAKYSLNFGLIAFCLFAVIMSPVFLSIDPIFGLYIIVLYAGLGYLLFNRTRKDYKKDRSKIFNKKNN